MRLLCLVDSVVHTTTIELVHFIKNDMKDQGAKSERILDSIAKKK